MFERKSVKVQPQAASSSSVSSKRIYQNASLSPSRKNASTPPAKGDFFGLDEGYESEGNLSIAASFTRTTAALNLGFDSEFEDNESQMDFLTVESAKSQQGGQTVAESWDDDFIFTSANEGNAESSNSSAPSKEKSTLNRDNLSEEEEISNWDSEGSEGSIKAPVNTTENQSGKNRLFRTASSQTIVPNSGQENQSQALSPKQGKANKTKAQDSINSDRTTPLQPSNKGESSTSQSSSQPQWNNNATTPTTPTSKKKWLLSKQSQKDSSKTASAKSSSQPTSLSSPANRPLAGTNRGKSPETPKNQAKGMKKQSTVGHGNDVQNGGELETSTSKRKPFGLGEKTWTKLLQSKLQRKKEQSANVAQSESRPSEAKATSQPARPSNVQDSQKTIVSPRKVAEPSNKAFPTITENSTIRANEPSKNSSKVQERPPARQAQSRPSLPDTFEQNNKISPKAERTPAKEDYAYGSISEHRHWASRLNKESPPRRGTMRKRSEGSSQTTVDSLQHAEQSEEKRNGKRKMDIEDLNFAHKVVPGGSPKGLIRPTRAMPSESTRRDSRTGVTQNRTASDSTTVSVTSSIDYDKSSMAGSNLTDASTDSSIAVSSPMVTQSHTPKIQIIRQLPSDAESLPSSTDSKLSRTRRPPPVSSGIESLTRRQAAMQLKDMSSQDRADARQESLDEDDLNGSDSRSVVSRKSDDEASAKTSKTGDLKIPSLISKAQEGVRADMMRIRNFATGIEELKGLRDAYHRILDRLDDHAEVEEKGGKEIETFRLELEHSEYVYGSWWECAEVLIGLANGKDELEKASGEGKGASKPKDQKSSNDRFSSVRRANNEKAQSISNSRASSSASRYVHPERERDILAAMLAGTPPEQASPTRSSAILPRHRTASVDTPSSRDSQLENRTIRDNRRMSSQSVIIQSRRRTSDPDPGKEKGKQADPNVQYLPFAPEQNVSNTNLDHLKHNRVMRQTSGGRRHLRSAGQQGLQGLKDLIVTIRRNSTTTTYRDEARTSQVSLRGSFGESSSEVSGGRKTPSGRRVNPPFGSGPGAESPAKPYPHNSEANSSKVSLQRPSTRLPKSSGSYDADGEKSAADAKPSRRFIRFARASSSSSAFSLEGSGHDSSIDSAWTEAELSTSHLEDINGHGNSHTFDVAPSKTISHAHRRTISMLSRALPMGARKNERNMEWNNFPSSSNAHQRGNNGILSNLRNNRSEAHLSSPSHFTSPTSIPPLPRTMSEERRVNFEGGGRSSESDWTLHEGSSSANRMRVMSADHLDLAAQKQAEEASEAFRKMAMRSEAMPSLNRYLDTTKARCRESLTVLKDLEGQIRGESR
ncbi:uncharacterized protein FA14DRAFT_171601 [Meira miltonrushii]|uniref:Uncharacterized protein n=1 Tax=Meira miltonrushii TaxID=1280837 RepID=A0A316VC45_9BASI|nr:uncharacterized protein FA14DRAFT_171601 [Meira miltonrushii]PWN34874.1 hypothetical protein FA14DRAFT_171601 [Meira miltonrushii]